ncbi:MAG: hypothetical protein L0Y57_08910 [Beijerinckiaceae bacterium]|nr:hypothetical protein [Beijerinckiaceae bacterium]
MISILLSSLIAGMVLGHFFKVLILVPAGLLAIVLVLSAALYAGDDLPQVILQIGITIPSLAVGYFAGQILVPSISRRLRHIPLHMEARPRKGH